jgi:xylose isomerase
MNTLTGTKEFFTGIDKIKFEGKESRNPWHSAIMMQKE